MPGAVARTSTFALNNATLRYGLKLADMGWKDAVASDPALKLGLNVCEGKVTYEAVATAHGLDYTPIR
jgi:alanine dehydrogenase